MTIAIMSPSARSADAVGYDTLSMFRVLKRHDPGAVLLTRAGDDELGSGGTYSDARWRLNSPEDLLIYHACTDDPDAMAVIRALDCRVIVKYHNITPPTAFHAYSGLFTEACRLGREGLAGLVEARVELFYCDSQYNADDLASQGARRKRLRTLPPFHPAERLLTQPDEPATLAYLGQKPLNLLMVGRLVPNKRHDLAIEAVGRLVSELRTPVRLQIVGAHDPRLENYIGDLRRLIQALGLEDAVSFHPVSGAAALASFYRRCDALVMPSDHEGFGVPAVEAMAFGLPIVAAPSAALPETIGEAGLFGRDAAELADALHRVLTDETLRSSLKRAGAARYQERYAEEVLAARFLEAIAAPGEPVVAGELADPAWFGLPGVSTAMAQGAPPQDDLGALDGQRRAIERLMRSSDPEAAELWGSSEMRRWASTARIPFEAHLRPLPARLAWLFSTKLQADFPLTTVEEARDFAEWFWRLGANRYPALAMLLTAEERAFASLHAASGLAVG